jgi:hypothetical protein
VQNQIVVVLFVLYYYCAKTADTATGSCRHTCSPLLRDYQVY